MLRIQGSDNKDMESEMKDDQEIDSQPKSDAKDQKNIKIETKSPKKETVDSKKTIDTIKTADVKPPKRSTDNDDVNVMAPPAKVSRLESTINEKQLLYLKIESIPGTCKDIQNVVKDFLKFEELTVEQCDEQTTIIINFQNNEDVDVVYDKLKELTINGNPVTITKHDPKIKVVPVDLFDEEYKGTYGLSEDFLRELDIKLPLSKWIHISNINCQTNVLKELMECAGTVSYCNVIHTKLPYAKVMFTHPLEAVQALSLFNKQMFYGRLLTVTMVQPPPNEAFLPKGVQKLGKGFGIDGSPQRNILKQFERYYNGEKFYIDCSVLESEKHKVPPPKKQETPLPEKEDLMLEKKDETKDGKKEEKKEHNKEEKIEDKKEEKGKDKKEPARKTFASVMTQTYALPSHLIQKMADLIKKGVSVTKISKVLEKLDDGDEDDVVIILNDDGKGRSQKGPGKRERPRSASPKPVAKTPYKATVKPPSTPLRPPSKQIPTRYSPALTKPTTPFNKPTSSSQQINNNFTPNNSFNNHQQPFNSGANKMGGFDQGNRNPNIGMLQNMGHNMQMGQQNTGMVQQNMPMGHQNMPMNQQNMAMGHQNMAMVQQNMPMDQRNMPMGQHSNIGHNNINPFNTLNQVVSMVQNAATAMGQPGQMGIGQMPQVSQVGQMGQSGQPMGQVGAIGQCGYQNQETMLGQGSADFLVLVNNLPQSVTFKLLHEKMSSCGDVKFLKMTNPGCAVVGYGELWEAQRCVAAFNKTVVDGHKVELRLM